MLIGHNGPADNDPTRHSDVFMETDAYPKEYNEAQRWVTDRNDGCVAVRLP
jgi:hypothetical protein